MLGHIAVAVRAAASITLISGVLVLAGALAAGHRRRVLDAVILKVLGARRRQLMLGYLSEYVILGLLTGLLAALVGSIVAYIVITELMGAAWIWLPQTVVAIVLLAISVTIGFGLAGTWAVLGVRPAPLLRND